MYFAAVPHGYGKGVQKIEVFVVSVNEKKGKPLAFKPVEPVFLGFAAVPYAAEIAANYYVTIFIFKMLRTQASKIGVRIAGYVNHFYQILFLTPNKAIICPKTDP